MRTFRYISLAAIFLVFMLAPVKLQAAEPQGVQVKPLRKYVNLDPGTTARGRLSLKNTTAKTQTITMSAELFSVDGLDYDYKFRDGQEVEWIQFSDSRFSLRPNQTKLIRYDLAVPGDASPGGHYFSLITTIDPPKEVGADGVREFRRVASLVYLEVSGDIIKNGNLTGFSMPWITMSRMVHAEVFLANSGNTHTRARVLVDGRSFSSRVLGQPKGEFAQVEGTLLPGTLRKLPTDIQLPVRPGFYRVAAQYALPQGGTITRERILFYVPLWFLGIVVIVVACIVLTSIRYVRGKNLQKDQSRLQPQKNDS